MAAQKRTDSEIQDKRRPVVSQGSLPGRKALPKEIAAAAAKTHLLQMLSSVEEAGEFVITRRGKAVAKLIPFTEKTPASIFGCMRFFGEVKIHGDIMAPLPEEEWGDLV